MFPGTTKCPGVVLVTPKCPWFVLATHTFPGFAVIAIKLEFLKNRHRPKVQHLKTTYHLIYMFRLGGAMY